MRCFVNHMIFVHTYACVCVFGSCTASDLTIQEEHWRQKQSESTDGGGRNAPFNRRVESHVCCIFTRMVTDHSKVRGFERWRRRLEPEEPDRKDSNRWQIWVHLPIRTTNSLTRSVQMQQPRIRVSLCKLDCSFFPQMSHQALQILTHSPSTQQSFGGRKSVRRYFGPL